MIEPTNLESVFNSIERVGEAASAEVGARERVSELRGRLQNVRDQVSSMATRPRVVLLEWIDPLFCSGHWNPELVEIAGGQEQIGVAGGRSRTMEWAELVAAQPECLIIACCGFSVERAWQESNVLTSHPLWKRLPCVSNNRVFVVDGSSYFNRPGPRLVDSAELLAGLIHPDVVTLSEQLRTAVRPGV